MTDVYGVAGIECVEVDKVISVLSCGLFGTPQSDREDRNVNRCGPAVGLHDQR